MVRKSLQLLKTWTFFPSQRVFFVEIRKKILFSLETKGFFSFLDSLMLKIPQITQFFSLFNMKRVFLISQEKIFFFASGRGFFSTMEMEL
jgi:hypothetical protein